MFFENDYSYMKSERNAYRCILVSVILVFCLQSHFLHIPNIVEIGLDAILVGSLFYGAYQLNSIYGIFPLTKYFIALIIGMAVIGFIRGAYRNHGEIAIALQQDWRYVALFLAGACMANSERSMTVFHQMMKVMSVIALIVAPIALFKFDYSVVLESRENTWSLSYYLWWASGAVCTYMSYYALFLKQDKILGYGTLGAYTILGMMFLKRSVLINVAVIFIIYLLLSRKQKIGNTVVTLLICAITIFITNIVTGGLIGNLYDLILGRFSSVDSINEFDRHIEMTTYFEQASISQIIFGNGIGHFFKMIGDGIIERSSVNALHMGWANIIYKGGVLYTYYYFVLYKRIFSNITSLQLSDYQKVCVGASLSALISLLYEGSWSYTFGPFCMAAPLFYIAYLNER